MSDPVYTIEQRARDGTLLSRMVGRYNRKTQTVEPVSVEYFVFLSTPSGWRATAKTDKVFVCFCAKGRRICLFKTRKEKNLPVAF